MKHVRILLLVLAILQGAMCYAQNKTSVRDSLINEIHENINLIKRYNFDRDITERYKMYPTENNYTFLKLDTKTGRIMQVQWSLDKEDEGSLYINSEDLSEWDVQSGHFELYPTKNMYQFILLDKVFGCMWHVQWGFEDSERWIRKIL